jgi:dTDP-4-amino-4,6-dideoxygalactose transaminase
MKIPFLDLKAEYLHLKPEIEEAVRQVLESGFYILGQEVVQFEREFAEYLGVRHVTGVASGTDALLLALRAYDIGPGDEVITVSHTAVATVAAIEQSGAQPILVDVEPGTCTMDPAKVEEAFSARTRAIVPVHIYGHPADMFPILDIARRRQLVVIEDCAQAHGATYKGRAVGTMGDAAAFSFYPTKNLGAIGDGGCVATDDDYISEHVRMLRQYGWRKRYVSEESGFNSRLDELQAAILRVKLRHLEAGNTARRRVAKTYGQILGDLPLMLPEERLECRHVYHLFVIQAERRDDLQAYMAQHEIATARHYPLPVHQQPAYGHLRHGPGSLAVTEALARSVLSLPIYPLLPDDHIQQVAATVASFYSQPG